MNSYNPDPYESFSIDKDYKGRILRANCSEKLKKRLEELIRLSFLTLSMDLPVFQYIAAWEDNKKDMWYEFMDPRFSKLFSADTLKMPKIFRNAVKEQKIYKKSEKDRLNDIEVLKSENLAQDRKTLRNLNIGKGYTEAIYKVLLPDKSYIWLKDQAKLESFPTDRISISAGVLTPVSTEMLMEEALSRAEKTLAENEQQFRDLFTQSNDAILILSLEGRILKANRMAEKLTGLSYKELMGKQSCDLFPESERKVLQRTRTEIVKGRKLKFESLLLKEGKNLDVDINALCIISADTALIQAVIRDISLQKQLQAEQNKELKFEMLKTLSAGLTHDINNLLSVIIGNVSLAAFEENTPPGVNTILERIETAASQLKNISRKMLVLARSDMGSMAPGQIVPCIKEALDLAGPLPSSIELKLDIPLLLPDILIDRKALGEVFAGIIENSINAMPRGGKLFIEAGGVSIREDESEDILQKGDYLCIRFKDTGKGIKEKDINKVFDPYFSTKERGSQKGTGLGLSLAYAVIKQHKGYIMVQSSEKNKGSETIIYLPIS